MVYIRSRDARKIQYPPYIKSAADILNTDKTIDLIWGTVLSDILVDGKMSRMRVTQSLAPFFTFQFLPSISIHTLTLKQIPKPCKKRSVCICALEDNLVWGKYYTNTQPLKKSGLRPYILALWSWNGEPGMYKLKLSGGLEVVALYQGAFWRGQAINQSQGMTFIDQIYKSFWFRNTFTERQANCAYSSTKFSKRSQLP